MAGQKSRQRALTALAAGALSVLATPPFFLWPVLFLTLPVLVWHIDGAVAAERLASERKSHPYPLRQAAWAGWWFGFGYFLAGLFWIGEAFLVEAEKFAWLLPVAVMGLPAVLAAFFAAAASAAALIWRRGWTRVFALALTFSAAEWLRGHVLTGLPWNVLGYAMTWPESGVQAASLLGIYGLTIVTIIAFAVPLVALAGSDQSNARRLGPLLLPACILLAHSAYGQARLSASGPAQMVEGVRLRIVQPSVPQREKWQREKQREIFDLHLAMSRRDASGRQDDLAGITHLVWPEAAMPFLPLDSPEALAEIAALLPGGVHLLTGALRADRRQSGDGTASPDIPRDLPAGSARRPDFYNSLLVLDDEARLSAVYDKIHLVPFGEYLPMQGVLEAVGLEQLTRLRGGFASGGRPRPLLPVIGLPPVGGLICYEAIFPDEVGGAGPRPGVFVNVTNDGWFGNTTGPRQHFHKARVRAVEQGVPLIRAANNGISAVIDPLGRTLGRIDLDVRGVLDSPLPRALAPTVYARFGDWIFLAFEALLASVLILLGLAGRRADGAC
ncbi:MAG: apolipoprotein N-acyltransferase [Hyphomicrobiaceae bacterium]